MDDVLQRFCIAKLPHKLLYHPFAFAQMSLKM